jgi:hypothetical protein
MRKKKAIEIEIEKATQRADHSFLVAAIFLRQKVKAMRSKVDERVTNDHCAATIRMIERKLAIRGAIDFDGSERSDLKTIGQRVIEG